jgi:hypothetical protein
MSPDPVSTAATDLVVAIPKFAAGQRELIF